MDSYLDASSESFNGPAEVIEGRGRRLRSEAERARIIDWRLVQPEAARRPQIAG